MFEKLKWDRKYLVHQPNCIGWHCRDSSLKPTRREQSSAPRDHLSQRACKTITITSAIQIHILNSYYNFFLNYNQTNN